MDGNGNGKVVVNLATGLEDPEKVLVAFLVAGAAATAGKDVTMFLTKEAVRLAVPGVAVGVASAGTVTRYRVVGAASGVVMGGGVVVMGLLILATV